MQSALAGLLLLWASTTAWAAPQGSYYVPSQASCDYYLTPLNVAKAWIQDGKATTLPWSCTSLIDKDGSCTLAQQASYSKSTSFSVGVGVDFKFKTPGPEIAPKFQLGYSWTTTTGKGTTAGVRCPSGGLRCGLMVTPVMCMFTGLVKYVWEKEGYNGECPIPDTSHPYLAASPCMQNTGPSSDMNAVMNFEVCLQECRKEDNCDRKKAMTLKTCPGYTPLLDLKPAQKGIGLIL